MKDSTLAFECTVAAPREAVYRALTDQAALTQWLCTDARTAINEGGRIYLYWQNDYDMTGRYTALTENELVAFSWHGRGEPAPTAVSVSLSGANGRTHIHLQHDGVGQGEAWAETRRQIQEGWTGALENLKMMLEQGVDKRVFDRPFMGLVPGGLLNDAERTALGVEGGLRLAQILQVSSMDAAGFQADDVLIQVNERDIKSFSDLGAVLGELKVGDQIDVRFARDGTLRQQAVTLGTRPLPAVPDGPGAFADQLAALYAELDSELDQIFAGVGNNAAFASPAAGEWSAAQVLGHLIVSERGTQMGVYVQLSGQSFNAFPGNENEIINSILAVYPDIHDLLAFLKRTEAETVALVRGLPAAYVAHKIDYLNLGTTLLMGQPIHTRSHMPQIRAALAAAG